MNILIFIIILILLVLVHEFGHFIAARKSGVRVDEFGIGLPPRIWGKQFGETLYSINALPFGGFVKIFGENAESLENPDGTVEDKSRSLVHKNRGIQAAVLVAGVTFNVIFAWIVLSVGFMIGMPTSVDSANNAGVTDTKVVISSIMPKSPAENTGLKVGDIIQSIGVQSEQTKSYFQRPDAKSLQTLINNTKGQEFEIAYSRNGKDGGIVIRAEKGLVNNDNYAIGISMDMIGILKLPVHQAIWEGGVRTIQLFKVVTVSIVGFVSDALVGKADYTQISGPVGMVGMVGDARGLGFSYLIFFTALLSINLAVINLIPFPALDGGRLVIVAIEAIKRSPLNPKFIQILNIAGFAVLILLLLAVTGHDILKFF